MTTQERCQVYITFESEPHQVKRGQPTIVTLKCSPTSRLFPYYLRQKLHKLKRIPPFEQELTKTSATPLSYSLKVRERDATQLLPLSIHDHSGGEYKLQIDKQDKVIDIKFLLSPLVNNELKAENIELNYNTIRRLHDTEIMYATNCCNNDAIIIMFWFEFQNDAPNESPIYQSVRHLVGTNPMYPDMGTTIRKICNQYSNDPRGTFGTRKYINENDFSQRGEYEYINYKRINDRIDTISCAIKYELGLNKNNMVGLCSINRAEWLLCDYACSVSSIVTVPLYPTLDADALQYITNHAQLTAIVTDTATINDIIALFDKCKSLKYIIVMDDLLPDITWKNSQKGQNILSKYENIKLLSNLERAARQNIENKKYVVNDDIPSPDALYTIMYTSGTTGPPKGVMLTHSNLMSVLNGFMDIDASDEDQGDEEIVHLSYLPLAHAMERILNLLMLMKGYKIGFFCGSTDRLIEDMNVIKPSAFFGVPRIFQKIQDTVMNGINSKSAIIRWLFNYAYQNKILEIKNRTVGAEKRRSGGFLEKYIFSKLFWSKINGAFGGGIKMIGSGSAPLSDELTQFLQVTLADVVAEGYGLTETSAGGTGRHFFDLTYGHVGQPRINVSLKLVDVPDMNYLVTDKPCPRGEIWMKGPTIFKGYYKDKKKTDEVLFSDGWFATGDIGIWRDEGRLQIIDRKKNIFKLSQGEYIRPEYIQNIYKLSRYIANIFVYGSSLESYLVAIIVPDFEALAQVSDLTENELKGDLNKNEKIVNLIANDMKIQADNAKLNGFEKVRKFKLFREEFSNENGLLTISMKLKRNVARERFANDLKELYRKRSKL